jgi:cystathionine beta-lyase
MTPSPIYRPFTFASSNMERGMVKTLMKDVNGRMELDFESIEALMSADINMFFFCNPHNPGGTVFSREEIQRLVDICEKYEVGICSDEIHCDLLLDDKLKHIHTATVSEYARENSVTLLGPCKTFNLAGLPIAAAVVPNPDLRAHFRRCMRGIVSHISSLSFVATEAAYLQGGEWHKELIEYLRINKELLIEGISKVEGLSLSGPEASYLAWIDCREAKLLSPAEFLIQQAKVGVHDGEWFGNKDYVRLNFGCPRSVLEESISRIQKAFSQRN